MEDACGRTCGAVQHDEATGEGKPSSAPKLVSEYLQHYKEQLLRVSVMGPGAMLPGIS